MAEVLADQASVFTPHEILPWVRQLSEALDYAHSQEVLHRDVKPGNVLLDGCGEVRLADFGIARLARDVRTRHTGEMSCGTLMYVSPEQLMGEYLDARSDEYSLAASVYELLSGAPPFYRGSIITQIQLKPAPAIPHLDPAVNAVLTRALSKDPDQRVCVVRGFLCRLCRRGGLGGRQRPRAAETRHRGCGNGMGGGSRQRHGAVAAARHGGVAGAARGGTRRGRRDYAAGTGKSLGRATGAPCNRWA